MSNHEEETMKILPTMSKGVVLLHEDGRTFEMAPFQVFLSGGGQTCIRIGRNAFFFERDGSFDGSECKVSGINQDSPEAYTIQNAFNEQGRNKGMAPEAPYFAPGSKGHTAETQGWPLARQEASGKTYLTPPLVDQQQRQGLTEAAIEVAPVEGQGDTGLLPGDARTYINPTTGSSVVIRQMYPSTEAERLGADEVQAKIDPVPRGALTVWAIKRVEPGVYTHVETGDRVVVARGVPKGSAEEIMHRMGWTDVWYAHPGLLALNDRWHVGIFTGPQNDLICVKHCDTNEEAERYLSPGASDILSAALASEAKAIQLGVVPRMS